MRFSVLVLVLAACVPAVAPVAPVDIYVDPNATPESACGALARLHCGESRPAANGTTCPDVVRMAMRLRAIDLACITAATDIAAVRQRGSIRCRE